MYPNRLRKAQLCRAAAAVVADHTRAQRVRSDLLHHRHQLTPNPHSQPSTAARSSKARVLLCLAATDVYKSPIRARAQNQHEPPWPLIPVDAAAFKSSMS
ncbi:hypothetical protein M0R45_037752 [Rubus argutus]|uniref:Uncharacterized protein n=1 Tax=Rubus argutus TaxID=59490 RepID=A0AAW1W372_RUBAR